MELQGGETEVEIIKSVEFSIVVPWSERDRAALNEPDGETEYKVKVEIGTYDDEMRFSIWPDIDTPLYRDEAKALAVLLEHALAWDPEKMRVTVETAEEPREED